MRSGLRPLRRLRRPFLRRLGRSSCISRRSRASAEEGHRALDLPWSEVQSALGRDLFSTNGETMQEIVGELCRARGYRIAAAESCTGRAGHGEADGSARQLRLRRSRRRRLQQSVENGSARRSSRPHRPARRRQRAGRRSDGQRHGPACRRRSRPSPSPVLPGRAAARLRNRSAWLSSRRRGRGTERSTLGCARSDSSAAGKWCGFRHPRRHWIWRDAGLWKQLRCGWSLVRRVVRCGGCVRCEKCEKCVGCDRFGGLPRRSAVQRSREGRCGKRLFIAAGVDEPTRDTIDVIARSLRKTIGGRRRLHGFARTGCI